jgi:hypothetical protein
MKIRSGLSLCTLLSGVLLAGCASTAPRITSTASGKPEVRIEHADQTALRTRLTRLMEDVGYSVDKDTPLLLSFRRPIGWTEGAADILSPTGASTGTLGYVQVSYTFLADPASTTVIANAEIFNRGAFLEWHERSALRNPAAYNALQVQLNGLTIQQ